MCSCLARCAGVNIYPSTRELTTAARALSLVAPTRTTRPSYTLRTHAAGSRDSPLVSTNWFAHKNMHTHTDTVKNHVVAPPP